MRFEWRSSSHQWGKSFIEERHEYSIMHLLNERIKGFVEGDKGPSKVNEAMKDTDAQMFAFMHSTANKCVQHITARISWRII